MSEKFHQYYIAETLSKKYSHVTYLASLTSKPERQVVLTVFASSLFRFPHESENLLQRAQHIKQLQHPHLVPILDMGIEAEQPFVVREYLPDDSLRSRLKKLFPNRLPLRDALNMVSQIGEALVYAHEHHIIHGNIKAENVLLDDNGQAFLTDFSLVSRKDAIIRDQTSEEYAFCYLAPEQFAGTCDARSDQYALGCLTYELIAGRIPFAAQSLSSMMGRPNNALPAPLSESVADLSPSLEAAVLKTLAKDPAERFFDFSLFLEVIRSILSPPPAFPLARSARSRKNRVITHPVRTAKAADISSPISNRSTPPNPVSEPLEQSGAISSVEVDAAEPMDTSSMFQAHMPEWTGISPLPESLTSAFQSYQFPFPRSEKTYPIVNRKKKKKADGWLVTDSFVQEEEEELPVIEYVQESVQEEEDRLPIIEYVQEEEYTLPAIEDARKDIEDELPIIETIRSIHENSEYAAAEETLLLTRNPDVGRPSPVWLLHNRRKVLGLVLLCSVIAALIVYIVLPLAMVTHDTSSHTVNSQVTLPRIASISTGQDSAPVTPIPTAQPSVTATPTAPPVVPVRNIPLARPRVSVPTPTPAPIVIGPQTYEAESSQNTLAGGAQVISCASCSGGYRVGYLGLQPNGNSGTLQFNNVNKISAGTYTLTLYYSNGATSTQDEYISINGGTAIVFSGSPTGSFSTVETVGVAVALNSGNNTIEFYNPQGKAPDVDKIVI